MLETSSEFTTSGSTETELPIAEQIAETIQELEQYRDRLINETMDTAKRAKLMKSAVMTQLEPELTKIDAALQHLREQQAELT
jgi:capsule polysaccharide export protein KpsE/RkpR